MTDDIEEVRQLTSEIDGCLSDDEGELLYKLAKKVASGQAIVEIGSWKGKSTVWLAKGTEAGQGNKVYSIDPCRTNNANVNEDERSTYTTFLSSLTKAGVQDTVVPLVKTSDEVAKGWRKKIGLLWFNAPYKYEDVEHTLLLWKRHLFPGAKIALHACDQPGLARLVEEYLKNLGDFTIIESINTVIVAETDNCIHYWIIDSSDIGVCKHCKKERDFKRLLRRSPEVKREEKAKEAKWKAQKKTPSYIRKGSEREKRRKAS